MAERSKHISSSFDAALYGLKNDVLLKDSLSGLATKRNLYPVTWTLSSSLALLNGSAIMRQT